MYRREMLDEIGGFDEDFFAYADDAELGLRARIAENCRMDLPV
jgi:GT2 family glycosyltransferase